MNTKLFKLTALALVPAALLLTTACTSTHTGRTTTPAGTPPNAGEDAEIALVPKGAKPGVVMAETAEVTARVVAVDSMSRRVTLQFVDGTTKTVRVDPDIDLANVAPGDAVTVRITEALAVLVEKP